MPSRSNVTPFPTPAVIGTIPATAPPSDEARARFAKRREAGTLAELMAAALGRSPREAGTARLALRLSEELAPLEGALALPAPEIVVTDHGRTAVARTRVESLHG